MPQNQVQYQKGLSMPEFFGHFGTSQQCEELVRGWRWPGGFVCPRCHGSSHSEFCRKDRSYFQCSAPLSVQSGQWHDLRVQQGTAAKLVLGDALDDAGQKQRLCAGA